MAGLTQLLDEIQHAQDLDALRLGVVNVAHHLDFGLAVSTLVMERWDALPVIVPVHNFPPKFLSASSDTAASRRDPVVARMKTSTLPFAYNQSFYTQNSAGDLWEEQAAHGFRAGMCVARHTPGKRFVLMGFDRATSLPKDPDRLGKLYGVLALASAHAETAFNRLITPVSPISVPLTRRETQVLYWASHGKSAWDTSHLICCGVRTIHFHVQNAMRKLKCSTKLQATLRAVQLGLLPETEEEIATLFSRLDEDDDLFFPPRKR